jgi:hypothetical protein
VHNNFLGKKNNKPVIHLSLGKAGPCALEKHSHVKALKTQGFPTNRCLRKKSTQTIVQGGTP